MKKMLPLFIIGSNKDVHFDFQYMTDLNCDGSSVGFKHASCDFERL